MSKPISFGFSSKTKPSSNAPPPLTSKPSTRKPISLPSTIANGHKSFVNSLSKPRSSALRDESEDEDDLPPKHEELAGFTSTGAILSRPKEQKAELVIPNSGNGDWRKRGKNLLPVEVQAARNGQDVVIVEKDEVSKVYGLQFAEKDSTEAPDDAVDTHMASNGVQLQHEQQPQKEMTEDERALAALLDDGMGKSKSTATIAVQANDAWQLSEADSFRADVSTRPDSSTLEEYAAMPVEDFGMAMLRGMGRKRRANGEIIELNKGVEDEKKRKERKQEGFLGIGAKPVKGLEGVELGAWGKSDMRKNQRGEGFFTPVMLEDKRTGERITEEEFERRKKAAQKGEKAPQAEEDWRDRRDRNLDRDGREKHNGDDHVNGNSRKRDRHDRDRNEHTSSRSRRDRHRDRDDREYDSSRSRKDRSRSRDRRRDDDYDDDDRDRGKDRERHRDKYRDDHRPSSSSTKPSDRRYADGEKYKDRERNRDRDRDRDDRGYRDRR